MKNRLNMSKNNSKYIFKYNKEGELYNYVELDEKEKVISYFKVDYNVLTRFDKTTNTKQLITFKNKVKLKQKFMVGESFITVFDADNFALQYKIPDKEKEIVLINNEVSKINFSNLVIKNWQKILQRKGIYR